MAENNLVLNGEQLKSMRLEAEFTQEELAKKIGVSRYKVNQIENNRPSAQRGFTLENLTRWYSVCKSKSSPETKRSFKSYLLGLLD